MKKSERKLVKQNEEFILKIEVSEKNSELIMKLDKIIHQDIISHKLPNDFLKSENTTDENK